MQIFNKSLQLIVSLIDLLLQFAVNFFIYRLIKKNVLIILSLTDIVQKSEIHLSISIIV